MFHFGSRAAEHHLMIHLSNPLLTFSQQLEAIDSRFRSELAGELSGAAPVMVRIFVSDSANQADAALAMASHWPACAVSVVEQPPLSGAKVALWAYLVSDASVSVAPDGAVEVSHGEYTHLFTASQSSRAEGSEAQTYDMLMAYAKMLEDRGASLLSNCVRTWFFVQNVDVNYGGVVKGRNDVFALKGLTPSTHFITSTGIGGRHASKDVKVLFDAYSVLGLKPEQMKFLYAPTHLNPTYEYGVSFERGTYIDYGDRRHVLISGTASINNRGEVVHPGNIQMQTLRMIENVEALLAEAGCSFANVGMMLIYLRDVADYAVVNAMFEERFPGKPKVILLAPVCRPGWLIEMECMAVAEHESEYPQF